MEKFHVIFLLTCLIGCKSPEDTEQEISKTVDQLIEADNNGDLGTVLSLYAEKAVLYPPGGEPFRGIENIKDNYSGIFRNSFLILNVTKDEIIAGDDWGICIGRTFGQVISKRDSSVREIDDSYWMFLEKNKEWKITRLIWNANH